MVLIDDYLQGRGIQQVQVSVRIRLHHQRLLLHRQEVAREVDRPEVLGQRLLGLRLQEVLQRPEAVGLQTQPALPGVRPLKLQQPYLRKIYSVM